MSAGVPGAYPDPQNPYANPGGYGYPPFAPQPQNNLGLAGFIVSLCGFVICLAFPIGLVLSLAAIEKEPKGFAVAGAIIGGIGTLMGVVAVLIYGAVVIAFFAACMGVGAAMQPQIQTRQSLQQARDTIEAAKGADGSYPGADEGNGMVQGVTDYWKTPVRYEPNGSDYVIRSAGPDMQFNTSDDITQDQNLPSFDSDELDPSTLDPNTFEFLEDQDDMELPMPTDNAIIPST